MRSAFSAMLSYFRMAYDALGGGKLTITPGDALLACARVHGYQALRGMTPSEMKAMLSQTWEELPPMLVSSSSARRGREEVLDYIDSILKTL